LYRILGEFSQYVVKAAKYDASLCPLAVSSLNPPDPAANAIEGINQTINAIYTETYIDPNSRRSFGFMKLGNTIPECMTELNTFLSLVQYFLDAEMAVRKGTTVNTALLLARQLLSKRIVSTSDHNLNNLLSGSLNLLTNLGVWCLDINMAGFGTIATLRLITSFISTISDPSHDEAVTDRVVLRFITAP
jgi:hypothetical protein